jgi:hypothetical protein
LVYNWGMGKKPLEICFIVSVSQVKTMADGGIRYVFDGSERDVDAAASMMAIKCAGNALELTARVIPKETEDNNAEETEDGEDRGSRKTRRYPYRS